MYQGHRHDDNDDVDDDYNDGDDGHDDDSHNDNYDDKGNRSELRSWERGGRKGQKITKVHQDHFCTWLLTGFNRLGWTWLGCESVQPAMSQVATGQTSWHWQSEDKDSGPLEHIGQRFQLNTSEPVTLAKQ